MSVLEHVRFRLVLLYCMFFYNTVFHPINIMLLFQANNEELIQELEGREEQIDDKFALENQRLRRENESLLNMVDDYRRQHQELEKIREQNKELLFKAEMAQRLSAINAQKVQELESAGKPQPEPVVNQLEDSKTPATGWNVLAKLPPFIFTFAAAALYLGRR